MGDHARCILDISTVKYYRILYDYDLEDSNESMTEQEKRTALDELRNFELTMNTSGFMNDVSSDKLLKDLVELRIYPARYGDCAHIWAIDRNLKGIIGVRRTCQLYRLQLERP